MLDFTRDHESKALTAEQPAALGRHDAQMRARRLVFTSESRLFLAARRIGGEDGAALAAAFCNMVRDGSAAPESWPLQHLVALLDEQTAADRQVERTRADLQSAADLLEDLLEHELNRAFSDTARRGATPPDRHDLRAAQVT